jgi:hypothetical protein
MIEGRGVSWFNSQSVRVEALRRQAYTAMATTKGTLILFTNPTK